MDFQTRWPAVKSRHLILPAAWSIVFVAAILAYWPGLDGPFLLDDFGSIAALGHRGGVTDWETFKAFVFGGAAGPTGRPLSLLSFLIDARDWPADAWPFKRTNLIIHLLNAALLGVVTRQILAAVNYDTRKAGWVTLLSVAFWLLHPFLVSTTLYVVQRMAQLSTTFVLVGLAGYMRGRTLLTDSPLRAYGIMSASVVIATAMATLCKENGILLPVLVGVLEFTVFSHRAATTKSPAPWWSMLFLGFPAAVVFLYLARQFFSASFFDIVPPRDFSMYERLLTQPRVLFDYLQNWVVPKLFTSGVFQDHFAKSEGLLSPASTLLTLIGHAVVIAIAILRRKQWPVVAFAVLFFYASHLLESTVVNLELYFEHRNYLAVAFLILPVALFARRRLNHRVFFLIAGLVVICLAGFTRYSADVWSSYNNLVEVSALKAPGSARAQTQYSALLYSDGRAEEALLVLERAIARSAKFDPALALSQLIVRCSLNRLSESEFETVSNQLSQKPYNARLHRNYSALTDVVVSGKCPSVTAAGLNALFTRMLQVPYNADNTSLQYSHLQYFTGVTHTHVGQIDEAITAFERSLSSRPGASHAMMMAAVLASSSFYEEALYFSERALQQLAREPGTFLQAAAVNESDIIEFQALVRADLAQMRSGDSGDQAP